MRLGFIGLGSMGSPIVRRLLDAGHELIVHDVDCARVEALVAVGAQAAESPRAVADIVETVLASLPSPDVVAAVTLGPTGVNGGARIIRFVDLGTTGQPTVKAVAAELAKHGVGFVDSPVSGGVAGASAGSLSLMVAGADADVDAVEPVLSILGNVFRVGREAGLGQTMKLLNNYLALTALAATSEAMVFGAKAGLDPETAIDILNSSSGRNSATQDKFPRAVLPRSFDYGFSVGLAAKDLGLFAEQADAMGIPLWIGSASRQVWQFARAQLGPDADFTEIVRPFEEWTRTEIGTRSPTARG